MGCDDVLAGDDLNAKVMAVLALPDDSDCADALEAALDGAEPALQVAIWETLWRIARHPEAGQRLEDILDSPDCVGDAGEELYMMARIAWGTVTGVPQDVIEGEGAAVAFLGSERLGKPERLALVIHGTWARDGDWWRPGGDFHEYLLTDLGLDYLYKDDEPFVWSGRNRGSARHAAAEALGMWVGNYEPDQLEVYAHSHGANVAMLATQMGLCIDRLVMMSPPVREDYYANWANVGTAYNIQAETDLVVGIARGGQKFGVPKVAEIDLDCDGHSASHEPPVWERNQIPELVKLRP